MMIAHIDQFSYYEIQNILHDQMIIIINTVPFEVLEILRRDKVDNYQFSIYENY